MAGDQFPELQAALRADPDFAGAFAAAATADEAVAIAAEHGIRLTPDQIVAAVAGSGALSDAELAASAGGVTTPLFSNLRCPGPPDPPRHTRTHPGCA